MRVCTGQTHSPTRSSVESLFRSHNTNLIRFLTTKLGSDSEAREAAQEAYLRMLLTEDSVNFASPRAYLYKVAQNVVHDMMRRAGVRHRLDITQISSLSEPATQERTIIASESLAAINCALAELSTSCREAFRLSRDEGLGAREIAAILGVSERMVRNYITTALHKIQIAVDDEECG
jgi:RNA polymerase sigma factor (sigma-70 family)